VEFLNYHHLRYFWAVAKEGNLRRAAEKMHVSQPSISAQIRALEDVLGEKLFQRVGRRLVLTETGQRVLNYADDIFALGQELLNVVKQRPTARPLRIEIGIADSLPKLVTHELIKPLFRMEHPIQAVCWEGKINELLDQLAAYRLDIILSDQAAPSSLKIKAYNHPLGECGIAFCAEAKLAGVLRRRFPKSLNDAPALLPVPTTALRRALDNWFQSKGISPRVIAEFDDAGLMKVVAADGLGFIALPVFVADEALTRYDFRIIGTTEECVQQLFVITPERKLVHPAVVTLVAHGRAVLHDQRPFLQPASGATV
jgi:LysR family transcriptional activator of nhaA